MKFCSKCLEPPFTDHKLNDLQTYHLQKSMTNELTHSFLFITRVLLCWNKRSAYTKMLHCCLAMTVCFMFQRTQTFHYHYIVSQQHFPSLPLCAEHHFHFFLNMSFLHSRELFSQFSIKTVHEKSGLGHL